MAVHARPCGDPTNAGTWIERLLCGSLSAELGRKPRIHAPDWWAAPVRKRDLIAGIRADRS